MEAPPVVVQHRNRKARCGMAVLGNPEEVDAVASSIRTNPPGESRVERKGGLVKSGVASRASELSGERATARVVRGYEATLERMPACRQTGSRVGVGYGPMASGKSRC